ncbi:hypothetical protein V6N11_063206 [Hibiscus sabdariffa]|uniref:Uncharacterized protein n=1 Tax=Hibiscus sabdariffa TaxID=183260 RepID=A0ABR2NWS5_9ROSI
MAAASTPIKVLLMNKFTRKDDHEERMELPHSIIMRQLTEAESKDKGKGKVKETTPKPRAARDLFANRSIVIASKNHSKPRGYLRKVGKNGDQEHHALHYLHNWDIALRETLLSLSPGVILVFPIFPVDLFAEGTQKLASPTTHSSTPSDATASVTNP